MVPPLLLKHKMHVSRPPRMPIQNFEQLAYRAIVWYRIANRYNGFEPEHTRLITRHNTAAIRAIAFCVLYVVMPAAVGLPDINLNAFDRRSGWILNTAEYETGLAFGIRGNIGARRKDLRLVAVEWPENGAFSAGRRFGMIDCVDEEGEAEDIGKEDELLNLHIRIDGIPG